MYTSLLQALQQLLSAFEIGTNIFLQLTRPRVVAPVSLGTHYLLAPWAQLSLTGADLFCLSSAQTVPLPAGLLHSLGLGVRPMPGEAFLSPDSVRVVL